MRTRKRPHPSKSIFRGIQILRHIYASLSPSTSFPLLFLDTVVGLDAVLEEGLPIFMLKVMGEGLEGVMTRDP